MEFLSGGRAEADEGSSSSLNSREPISEVRVVPQSGTHPIVPRVHDDDFLNISVEPSVEPS